MYRRKGRNEYESAVKKFLEHNRDPGRRLKALRHAEGTVYLLQATIYMYLVLPHVLASPGIYREGDRGF